MHHVPTMIRNSLALTILTTSMTDSNAMTEKNAFITKTTAMSMLQTQIMTAL